jgi:hypothetical protein
MEQPTVHRSVVHFLLAFEERGAGKAAGEILAETVFGGVTNDNNLP